MRVKFVYQEHGEWAPAKAQPLDCPHPRDRLRFDGSFAMPCYLYCRDCGTRYLSPYHGMTQEQIDQGKARAEERLKQMEEAGWFKDNEIDEGEE